MELFAKGRGAQINTPNPFDSQVRPHEIKVFEDDELNLKTRYITTYPKTLVNKVTSPDVGMEYSANPYQGCEHGCVYCYARNSHTFWGYSAGLDFEAVILVKKNAPQLLAKKLASKNWEPAPIVFSGNTDCYQPIEKKLQITRRMLEVCKQYDHPVGIITKNRLVMRDMDILQYLNNKNLIKVTVSLNSLDDSLRQKLEPRASSIATRLKLIEELCAAGIPTQVLAAPIIPGLNDHELHNLVEKFASLDVYDTHCIMVRLNGDIAAIFEDWLHKTFPDRAQKVLNKIKDLHGGKLNDSRFGSRMRGEGKLAESLHAQFALAKRKYMDPSKPRPQYDLSHYMKRKKPQLSLF